MNQHLIPNIEKFIKEYCTVEIAEERKIMVKPLIEYVQTQVESNSPIRLNFICTHNSRRSHFSQIWAQAMSFYFGLDNLISYSGGTEATALFHMVVTTIRSQGFEVQALSESTNPIYAIRYSNNEHPIIGFSKTMNNTFNPSSNFAAIMTCDSANEACPVVPGADKRIPITYKDPKEFDSSPLQAEKYQEKSIEIAREMHYIFNQINLSK